MKKVLKIVPIVQSMSILEENVKTAKKKDKKTTDFFKTGTKSIVGISLASETANFIEDF